LYHFIQYGFETTKIIHRKTISKKKEKKLSFFFEKNDVQEINKSHIALYQRLIYRRTPYIWKFSFFFLLLHNFKTFFIGNA